VRRHFRRKRTLPIERLRGEDATRALIAIWRDCVEDSDERRARLPQLQNTDGDPFVLVADHYRFVEATRSDVEAALVSLPGASEAGEEDDGTRSVTFYKRGTRQHAHWDNTVVGTAFLSGDELRLETNSVRRANALRKKVEKACRGLLTGRRRSKTDPREMLHEQRENRGSGEETTLAGHDDLVREEKARHYATWPDIAIPMLGNRTPRQAARSRQGREELALLLKDMENHEAREPAGSRFDVNLLRRELGIEE
jgi:hypothetical protein